jgi:hypothetical protein
MIEYERYCNQMALQGVKNRHLILVVTGSGERKKIYAEMIKENRYKWKNISIVMKYFAAEDYPKMIACADVGVCLHYSSSGFDLPMKVGCKVTIGRGHVRNGPTCLRRCLSHVTR